MTTHYTHFTIEESVTLMIMRMQGSSLRAIAQVLGRQPSTQEGPGHSRLYLYEPDSYAPLARVDTAEGDTEKMGSLLPHHPDRHPASSRPLT